MDLENHTDSLFTDRTNTIPKDSQTRHVFTKEAFKQDQDYLQSSIQDTPYAENNFKSYLNKDFAKSITPTKIACSRLKLTDDGEIIRKNPHHSVLSIHADSSNLPEGAFMFNGNAPISLGDCQENNGDLMIITPTKAPIRCNRFETEDQAMQEELDRLEETRNI